MRKFNFFVLCLFAFVPFFPAFAQEVEIVWQGDTYTPPFYEGRSLWAHQSRVTLMAITHGSGYENPANVFYRWTQDGTVLGTASGIGKNSISFSDSVLSKPQTIKVDIRSASLPDDIVARNSVTIFPRNPVIGVYENNPLYGILFHKEVGVEYTFQNEEVTFSAFPYFFSALTKTAGPLRYNWLTNSRVAGTDPSITYRVPENTGGKAQVSIKVSNNDKFTQGANKNFLVQFKDQNEL